MKVFAIKNKWHLKREIPRLPFLLISPSTEAGCSNPECCFALIVCYPQYLFNVREIIPKSEEEKEAIISTGHWMNSKLSLGLDLSGTTESDASPENVFGKFATDSQLPQNNL